MSTPAKQKPDMDLDPVFRGVIGAYDGTTTVIDPHKIEKRTGRKLVRAHQIEKPCIDNLRLFEELTAEANNALASIWERQMLLQGVMHTRSIATLYANAALDLRVRRGLGLIMQESVQHSMHFNNAAKALSTLLFMEGMRVATQQMGVNLQLPDTTELQKTLKLR